MSTITLFPRRTWPSRLGHATAALVLVAFVAGVPIALSLGGSPFPAHWPHLSAAWRDLRAGYVPSVVLANVALLAGWCVWAFLSFEIVTETGSVLRSHTSRRAAALGPLQPLIAKLVATAVLSLPLTTVRPILRPASASAVALSAARPAARAGALPTASLGVPAREALPTYTVRRGDTLWGIAERYLGDPLRWTEIASLNTDRREGSGEFTDPHWIYPGWTLVLPADAKGLPTATPSSGPTATTPGPATPHGADGAANGNTPSHRLATGHPRSAPVPANSLRQSSRSDSSQQNAAIPRAASSSSTNGRDQGGDQRSASHETAPHPSRVPVAPVGLGILAVGLLALLVRLRRTQERHRQGGARIPLPTGATADIERALSADVDQTAATLVDQAGRLLNQRLRDAEEVPVVLGAVVTDDVLEYQLGEAATAPAPFTNSAPDRWRLDRSDRDTADALAGADDVLSMLPALVTVGTDEDGFVMLNLEAVGSVALAGDPGIASELATAIGLELASASWPEFVELFDVGIGTERAVPGRCTTVESIDEALAPLARAAKQLADDIERSGWTSLLEARVHNSERWWTPSALIAAHPTPPAALGPLQAFVAEHGSNPLVVVVGDLPNAALRLELNADGTVNIPVLARTVVAHRVSRAHLAGIAALLGLAAKRTSVAASVPPYADLDDPKSAFTPDSAAPDRVKPAAAAPSPRLFDPLAEPTPLPDDSEVPSEAPAERHVEVNVLGPIELIGGAREPERSKSIELVTWLVLHRGRGETDTVATALWPTRGDAVNSVWNIIWDARRMLGNGADGKPLLQRAGDLLLSDEVTTDWAHFCQLARSVEPAKWHEALALVRGRPLGDVSWGWATLDGHQSTMTAEITDVACRAAERALDERDTRAALWSAEAGLRACPYDERLFRFLMRAHDLDGNLAAVRETMERLEKVVEDDIEPVESVHPETNELYAKLMRRAPERVGRPPHHGASENGVIRPLQRRPRDA